MEDPAITTAEARVAARTALAKARASVGAVKRDAKGQRSNRYVTADTVRDVVQRVCAEHGLIVELSTPDPGAGNVGQFLMLARVIHIETGLDCCGPSAFRCPTGGDPQGVASLITYGTRYLLCMLFMIVGTDDDDGESAQKSIAKARKKARASVAKDLDDAFDAKADEAAPLRDKVRAQFADIKPSAEEWAHVCSTLDLPTWKLDGFAKHQLERLAAALEDGTVSRAIASFDPFAPEEAKV